MAGDERQQLARIAVVADDLDLLLDKLSESVPELKATLGAPGAKPVPVTEPAPPPDALQTARAIQGALEAMSGDLKAVTARLGTTDKTAAAKAHRHRAGRLPGARHRADHRRDRLQHPCPHRRTSWM
jgi:hypothetical protein